MKTTSFIVLIYGLLVLIGGILGFTHGSNMSLIMGGACGLYLIIASFFINVKKPITLYLPLLMALFLEIFFTSRYMKTAKFMPAGLMMILSLVVILFLALSIKRLPKERPRSK